jgi:glycosyltransferase involved in cell wall biosynthesis
VLLNALFLDPGVSGGSETYLLELVPALLRARPGIRFEIATTRRGAEALVHQPWRGEVRLIRVECDDREPVRRTLAERLLLPDLGRRRGVDVLHSLSNRGPRRAATAHVVTVHDVIFFERSTMGFLSTRGMRWAVRAAVAGADAVIAVSEAARHEIANRLRIPASCVVAIPHGPGRPPSRAAPQGAVRDRLGLGDGPVLLCVAAKRPHKNQRLLIEALPLLPHDVQLVLAGHDEGYGAQLERAARERGVVSRVHSVGYLPDAELEALWATAACAVFPTRAEGFGLPVLEAMRRGLPVACSDLPVLREVGGDVPHYFPPDDAAAAAAAIRAAIDDPQIAARGRARAARFTWERAAERTLDVYEQALARHAAA